MIRLHRCAKLLAALLVFGCAASPPMKPVPTRRISPPSQPRCALEGVVRDGHLREVRPSPREKHIPCGSTETPVTDGHLELGGQWSFSKRLEGEHLRFMVPYAKNPTEFALTPITDASFDLAERVAAQISAYSNGHATSEWARGELNRRVKSLTDTIHEINSQMSNDDHWKSGTVSGGIGHVVNRDGSGQVVDDGTCQNK